MARRGRGPFQFAEPVTPDRFAGHQPPPPPSQRTPEPSPSRQRQPRRTPTQKIDDIIETINKARWTMAEFLENYFQPHLRGRSDVHRASLTGFLQGHVSRKADSEGQPIGYAANIVDLIYRNELGRPPLDSDEHDESFSTGKSFDELRYAQPAISTWATDLVARRLVTESNWLVSPDAGLRFDDRAPLTVHLLTRFIRPKERKRRATSTRHYRPVEIVITSLISEMLYARNQWVNLLPLVRSISFFAMKAHQSIYRVGSRFAHCTPYSTTRRALVSMAKAKRAQLNEVRGAENPPDVAVVLDNIQASAKRRDQRIGTSDKMIIGTGATAVYMEDCPPGALDLDSLLEKRKKGERRMFSAQVLVDDIDFAHLDTVATLHWLDALVFFVPDLACYRSDLTKLFATDLRKHQINPLRQTQVQPLGTNAFNETSTTGMIKALRDFSKQLGIDSEDKLKGKVQLFHGDGKTFETIGKVKKYLFGQPGNFESFQFAYEVQELWHMKWTDLVRICQGKMGKEAASVDPSTLAFLAVTIGSPVPSDSELKKVEFYPNARLLEVAVKTHMLHCWETHLGTNDLPKYFQQCLANNTFPPLQELRKIAYSLHCRYSTTHACERALDDQSLYSDSPHAFPRAENIPRPSSESANHDGDITMCGEGTDLGMTDCSQDRDQRMDIDSDSLSESSSSHSTSEVFKGDYPLANSCLLMRDGIWFLEVCRAVATGDTGRVWEILKVWIFTFAGSGHSNYTTYLLELYCKFRYETDDATRTAIMNNWLVNLSGKHGQFLELDLMQEHFNFWLEELAQHKGKEFDDEWYRDVLSMHVHHFLRLKEEMEAVVQIAPRRKTHTAPHLQNEYQEALRVFREYDLHRHHEGRDFGFHAKDDYKEGMASLQRGKKVAEFIEESMRERDSVDREIKLDGMITADARTYMCPPMQYSEEGRLYIPDIIEENE
ncbi:hypothetical protein BXZ70DRAFT_891314 [Cristinia sonorae]|uniref:DUF6589 domain-containing protein n=1 Tax=Cristinia sonorae TaxID=1940300 RepID=A0A8K0XRL5_9AGAR|nr:hypothetical protein BXZ70DRAFT_891355 [Cristinia sonorae]KAH8101957.1 hypothetical protein BXZ70DRAFT_891314 [Cristinia sonorae]